MNGLGDQTLNSYVPRAKPLLGVPDRVKSLQDGWKVPRLDDAEEAVCEAFLEHKEF